MTPTRVRHILLVLPALLLGAGGPGTGPAWAQGPQDPEVPLREGRYGEAIELLERRVATEADPAAATALAGVLFEVGRFEAAEAALRDALPVASGETADELRLLLGRVFQETGRLDEALETFQALAGTSGPVPLLAELHRGELLLALGEREAALDVFDGFIDVYNRSSGLESRELQAVATAVRHLGVRNPALYQDALRAYDEAVAADPGNLEAHLGLGTLFLQSYNAPDARQAFRQVLSHRARHPGALVGLARVLEFEGSPELGGALEQILELSPELVPALVLRARLRLSGEEVDSAREDLERALAVNPTSTEALAVLAASAYLGGDEEAFTRIRDRALERNPRNADFFVQVAELVSRGRLYAEAADFAGHAASLDPLAWDARGVQGLNQLRIGEMEAGRANLEAAFSGDPFNVWIKNTLDLLDVMDDFEEWSTERIQVLVDPEDGGALAIYMLEVAEISYEALVDRYGYAPTPPVRVEAFRRSADFSVRTMGLTGLGALGVSFGTVLAMDSPAARGPQGFHWASTLWHEMAHAVHLGMTDHRVPRWLSEGLAVREERLARPGWGMRPSIPFFAAYLEGRLRSPSELSLSFVRPRAPDEVGHAYVLGSVVSEWMEEEWGFSAVLGMLEGYRDGLSPEEVTRRELGVDPTEMDARFDRWFRDRHSGGLAAAAAALETRGTSASNREGNREWLERRVAESDHDVEARTALGRLLLEEGRHAEARALALEARDIFPENPDPRGPNRLLARTYLEEDREDEGASALAAHLAIVAGDLAAQLELAEIRERQGRAEDAARALENAIWIYPFDVEVHERLAALYRELGDAEGEVRERRVLLALGPVDRAGAYHGLAEAQFRAGLVDQARQSVLRALELAPRFPEAQDLLLRIVSGSPGNEG
jgi:cellulose synthase operon protein C